MAPGPTPPFDALWRLSLIAAATLAVYANSLTGAFLFDDFGAIVRNPQIQHLWQLSAVLRPPADSPVAGRPMANLSFAVNYALNGLDVAGYHVVNIALHVVCAWLIFAIVRLTIGRLSAPGPLIARASSIALVTALLWAVHPLTSEVVDYILQRTESLMAVCYLAAIYAAARAAGSRRATAWLAASVTACLIGAGCKESIATAPIAVLLYDRAFLFDSFRSAFGRRWRFYASLTSCWALLALGLAFQGQTPANAFSTAPTSWWTYLLNQMVMLPHYARLVVWPRALVIYYGWPRALTLADVWLPAVVVTAAVIAVVVLYARRPRLGFVGMWCLLTLAPTSSVIPIATEVGAERRMYLPLAGLLAYAAAGLTLALARLTMRTANRQPRLAVRSAAWTDAIVFCGLAVALGAATIARNREYASAVTMAETTVERWPTPGAEFILGTALADAGDHESAIRHLTAAVAGDPPARYFLGAELFRVGRYEDAIATLQRFIHDEPRIPVARAAHVMIARAYELRQQWPNAIAECDATLREWPDDPDAHGLLADALSAEQRFTEAVPHYRVFVAANTGNAGAWSSLGIALVASGQAAQAAEAFRHAVDANPADAHLWENLARALLEQGDASGAFDAAARAVAIDARDPAAHDVLGRALAAQGRIDAARQEFARALALDPQFAPSLDALKHLRDPY